MSSLTLSGLDYSTRRLKEISHMTIAVPATGSTSALVAEGMTRYSAPELHCKELYTRSQHNTIHSYLRSLSPGGSSDHASRCYWSLYKADTPRTDQIDHDLTLDPNPPFSDAVHDLYSTDSNPGNMPYIMQIIRLPPGNMS